MLISLGDSALILIFDSACLRIISLDLSAFEFIFKFSFFQISTLSSERSGEKKKLKLMKKKILYLSLIVSLIIFFLISCFGAGKLNLLNKNKSNKKAKIYKKKFNIFF